MHAKAITKTVTLALIASVALQYNLINSLAMQNSLVTTYFNFSLLELSDFIAGSGRKVAVLSGDGTLVQPFLTLWALYAR